MKVLRSTLVAAVAIFAAACGDKVTVAGPTAVTLTSTTTTTPVVPGKVNSVSIAPATATLTIGQTITMIAAVNADAGIATTVTWTSSDATKASVSAAGLVTALVATPGVAICATSTANTGVKGCGSVVVTAASAVIPATATIAGVFAGNLSTILDPTNVAGRVNVQVNISTGTEVVSKAYLLLGTAVVDSQNFSAAQSASLRYAGENADAAKDVSQPTIILTANTAAYNATTGAVTFANATGQALSVQLFVGTAVRSTAKYSSTLTLNNPDVVYGSWTLPSTKVQAADASGYQWTSLGGGVLKMNLVPALYSGKTVTSVTVKYPSSTTNISKKSCAIEAAAANVDMPVCYSAATFGDTAQNKTVTVSAAGAISVDFSLWDRSMDIANVATPITPTFSAVYSDGSSTSDAAITAATGSSLALRIDNQAPNAPTLTGQMRGGSTTALRGAATWTQRPAVRLTDADSSALISAIGADAGVSAGSSFNGDLRGITYAVYASTGGTSTTNDSSVVSTTAITAASALTEGLYYCIRIAASDKLGNVSKFEDSHLTATSTIVTSSKCRTGGTGSGFQKRSTRRDDTAPVIAWNTTGLNYSSIDTVGKVSTTGVNYYWTDSETSTDSVKVTSYSGASATTCPIGNQATASTALIPVSTTNATLCQWVAPSAVVSSLRNVSNVVSATSTVALSAATINNQQLVITAKAIDAAGNKATDITRVMVVDAQPPSTPSAPAGVSATVDAASISLNTYATDNMSVGNSAMFFQPSSAIANSNGLSVAGADGTALLSPKFYLEYTGGETLGSTALSSFLNVALSLTFSNPPQYIAGPLYSNSHMSDAVAVASRASFGVEILDQALSSATSATMLPTFSDALGTFVEGSAFAGISGGTSTSSATFTNVAAANSVFAGTTTSGAVTSGTLTQKITTWRYASVFEAQFLGGLTYKGGANYCTSHAVGASATSYNSVTGAQSALSVVGALTALSAPTIVRVFGRTNGNGLSYMQAGTATLVATDYTAGDATTLCDDTVTRTYQYTFQPGVRSLPAKWHPFVNMVFMYTMKNGYAVFGPGFGATYTP